jgi:tetratricopeptide (TPR) repeat protein
LYYTGGKYLSSIVEKQLQEVEQLIIHGKFIEANEIINTGLQNKKISKEDELYFLAYKSELELYFGNYDESIRLADYILKNSKELNNPLLNIDALTWKAACSLLNGKIKMANKCFEDGLKQVSEIKNLSAKIIAKRKSRLLFWQVFAIIYLGNFEKGLELASEALSFAEISGYKNLISRSFLAMGDCYYFLGRGEKRDECFEKAFNLATKLDNKYLTAMYYLLVPRTYNWFKEPERAEESYNKGFSLAEEIGAKMLFIYKTDFGWFYRRRFQFDKAIKYFKEAIEAAPFINWVANNNIGYTYFLKYELKQAREYYLKSMIFCEEINDRYQLPTSIYQLIVISLELNELEQAKQYLKRLKELKDETGYERINHIYRGATILILKASGKISDLAKAAELIETSLAEESFVYSPKLNLLYSLLEIRLKELQFSPTKDNLIEVQKRLYHLEVEAEERQYKIFLIDIYRLQSQLALVELDVKKAIEILDKAQHLADEIEVELSKKRIKEDRKRIDQQLTEFKKFQEQKAPISDTVKLVSLETTAQNIKRETIIEEKDQETGETIEYRNLFSLKI